MDPQDTAVSGSDIQLGLDQRNRNSETVHKKSEALNDLVPLSPLLFPLWCPG